MTETELQRRLNRVKKLPPWWLSGDPRDDIRPPSWLRHFVTWRMLHWLSDRYHLCWAGLVMWKLGYGWSWNIGSDCIAEHDYCGYYDKCSKRNREAAVRMLEGYK